MVKFLFLTWLANIRLHMRKVSERLQKLYLMLLNKKYYFGFKEFVFSLDSIWVTSPAKKERSIILPCLIPPTPGFYLPPLTVLLHHRAKFVYELWQKERNKCFYLLHYEDWKNTSLEMLWTSWKWKAQEGLYNPDIIIIGAFRECTIQTL